jgi:hypothetical protein
VGHVPGEEGLEGFGGVFVMPVAGSFPGEHLVDAPYDGDMEVFDIIVITITMTC